ncbi:MAG: winged helix-turn-helix domain-containing protein [Vicinamibacterales bacterium]
MQTNPRRLTFGRFELDLLSNQLLCSGQPVKIQPQPRRVLVALALRAGEVVSRDELRRTIWDTATFVEFDQGLNYCIRQIRVALNDSAEAPRFLETVKKQGYRFIAPVVVTDVEADRPAAPVTAPAVGAPAERPASSPTRVFLAIAGVLVVATVAGGWLYVRRASARSAADASAPAIQQITDFADSALAPALSPDGRMLAFIRGGSDFLTPDQIYVKMLPDGEARRLTSDPRLKYGLTFSPDGSEVAYTVMEGAGWSTYAVSVLGGEPQLILANAAGLTWLDRDHLLFSQIKRGQHMGIVSAPRSRADLRELYFPPHERGMAHYSFASPDRTSAIVVEMGQNGGWLPCRLIALKGTAESHQVGPDGSCRAAAWSPDGAWMYFAAQVSGARHLWRQRAPDGVPEQITFGPTIETGIAVDPDGRSLVTSIGERDSSLWLHEPAGDRQLSSEGQVLDGSVIYSPAGQYVYYLARRDAGVGRRELQRLQLKSGPIENMLSGVPILSFDISPDGTQIVYTTPTANHSTQIWIAPIDLRMAPKTLGLVGDRTPFFGPGGEVLFAFTENNTTYLGRVLADGSGRSKVVPYPISNLIGVSPGRRWVTAIAPLLDRTTVAFMAIPVAGGPPTRICENSCRVAWSSDGKFLFVSVEEASLSSPGRALAISVGPDETLPAFPATGIPPLSNARAMPGARSVPRAEIVPGRDPDTFLYVQTSVHRNLFRIRLPPGH